MVIDPLFNSLTFSDQTNLNQEKKTSKAQFKTTKRLDRSLLSCFERSFLARRILVSFLT